HCPRVEEASAIVEFDLAWLERGHLCLQVSAASSRRLMDRGPDARRTRWLETDATGVPQRLQRLQRPINLRRNCARRYGLREGVFPQIAHQAAPGTFAAGQ